MLKREVISKSINAHTLSQPGQGRGGPMDMATFRNSLNQGVANIMKSFGTPQQRPSAAPASTSFRGNAPRTGFRTDRNNNPTAMTTAVAAQSGLVYGKDYVQGDPFSGGDGRVYYTAKLLGDPIQTTIKALDGGGFYTQGGKPRWSYTNALSGIQNWGNLNYNQKASVIAQMYKHEGGSGQLVARTQQPQVAVLPQLGNLTSHFGEKTADTDFHRGVDIANAKGTPIPKLSPSFGKVSYVGNNGDYGNEVKVQNNDGTTETYGHLSVTHVQPGQTISGGQPVGLMGDSGNSWSPSGGDSSHLHYEIADAYNRLINPLDYLKQL